MRKLQGHTLGHAGSLALAVPAEEEAWGTCVLRHPTLIGCYADGPNLNPGSTNLGLCCCGQTSSQPMNL